MTETRKPFKATFLTSADDHGQMPLETSLEVVFAGRSNTGKSSVLNAIAGARALARTSKSPGHTRLMNFYDLAEGGRLVDLPGYGYAGVSKATRRQWQRNAESYLATRRNLVGVVLIVDCRRLLRTEDRRFIDQVQMLGLDFLVLLNKADKLSRAAALTGLKQCEQQLAEQTLGANSLKVQLFSAKTGAGLGDVLAQLGSWLRLAPASLP